MESFTLPFSQPLWVGDCCNLVPLNFLSKTSFFLLLSYLIFPLRLWSSSLPFPITFLSSCCNHCHPFSHAKPTQPTLLKCLKGTSEYTISHHFILHCKYSISTHRNNFISATSIFFSCVFVIAQVSAPHQHWFLTTLATLSNSFTLIFKIFDQFCIQI